MNCNIQKCLSIYRCYDNRRRQKFSTFSTNKICHIETIEAFKTNLL